MEDTGTPFRALAPTYPVPVDLDFVLLEDEIPADPSKIKIIQITE